MSSFSQFLQSATPLGGYALFSGNQGNTVTQPDGKVFLKSGVLAKASDYPTVPAAYQAYLNPLVPVSTIGSGGIWCGIAIDPQGYPYVVSDQGGFNGVSVMGLAADTSDCTRTLAQGSTFFGIAQVGITAGGRPIFTSTGTILLPVNQVWMGGPTGVSAGSTSSLLSSWSQGSATTTLKGSAAAINTSTGRVVVVCQSTTGGATNLAHYGLRHDSMTSTTISATAVWTGAAWAATPNVFVAVASGGTTAASSADGITWTARTLPTSANWSAVASNLAGTAFCAVASGSTAAATSTDGLTWTARTLPVSASWSAVAHNGTVWCAVAMNSNIAATSPDGITWTQRTLPATADWTDVKWSPALGVFMACASDGRAALAYSTDGTTWTAKPLPRTMYFSNFAVNGTTIYAFETWTPNGYLAQGFATAKSTDGGLTWRYYKPSITGSHSGTWMRPRFLNGQLVYAVKPGSNTAQFYTSSDGITWAASAGISTGAFDAELYADMSWNGTTYTLIPYRDSTPAETGTLLTSPALTTAWTPRAHGVTSRWVYTFTIGTNIFASAWAPTNTQTFYLIKSTDNGATWATIGTNFTATASAYAFYNEGRGAIEIFADSVPTSSVVSFNQGVSWHYVSRTGGANAAYPVQPGGGGTYSVQTGTQTIVASNQFMTTLAYTYSHGYSLLANRGPLWTVSGAPAPTFVSGTAYYTDGSSFLKPDTALYIDNTKQVGEIYYGLYANTANYYMRVK